MKTAGIVAAALACLAAGCQTRITAEKHAEHIVPIEEVVTVNGEQRVIVRDVVRASGGWYATARSPLWASEAMRGLSIGVHTNGTVTLGLDAYDRDLSTNAVALTGIMCDAASDITAKVCAAIVSHGGSVAADGVAALVRRYIEAGGRASTASVTCEDGSCAITDTSSGLTCTDGGCSVK